MQKSLLHEIGGTKITLALVTIAQDIFDPIVLDSDLYRGE
jgi:hypothetical protein